MDVSADGAVLPASESSWVPSTPAKPSLASARPICAGGQENHDVVCEKWFRPQIISRGDGKGNESEELGTENLPERFCGETHAENASAPSVDINGCEAAIGKKPQLYRGNASVYSDTNSSAVDADKCQGSFVNGTFRDLLALAHAAAEETGFTSSFTQDIDSQVEGSILPSLLEDSRLANPNLLHATDCWTSCDQIPEISNRGTAIHCTPSFDLNSPPRTSDFSSKEIIQFHFAPITPDQVTRAYKEQVTGLPSGRTTEIGEIPDKGHKVREVELNKLLQKSEQKSQVLVDQLIARPSTELQENHAPDKGGSQGDDDLNKTPQQKPRRKKHRPKVIIEGQPKRTPKPRTPKPTAPEGSVPVKRKYVRRNGGQIATDTPVEKGTTDGDASTTATPDSEENPLKRKYITRQGVQQHPDIPLKDGITGTDQMTGRPTKSSCRRSLSFDSESQARANLSGVSSKFGNGTHATCASAQDHSSLNVPLQHGNESRQGKPEVGISSDLYCSTSQRFKHNTTIPESQVSAPATSSKNHQLHDKSMQGHQNEGTRGKCHVVFSNATHDKEINDVQMMLSTDAYRLKSPSSSNCSSGACLTEETQARGPKQHLFYMTEAELCSTNVTGAHYNSLSAYLPLISQNESKSNLSPRFHFPEIHKKRRTEKVYRPATCRAESSMSFVTRTCSTDNVLPSSDAHIHGLSATHSDSNAALTRHSILHSASQQKQYINCLLGVVNNQKLTKKRSKAPTRARASLWETQEQLLTTLNREPTKFQSIQNQTHGYMEGTAQSHAIVTKKKRSKRSASAAPPLAITWKSMSPIDEVTERFRLLNINAQNSQIGRHMQNALIRYQAERPEQNALVVYQRDGTMIRYSDSFLPSRRRKPRPKVDLDDETSRVWKLLLEDINSEGIDGTDEEKAKWWEEERRVFRGRTDSFIARMHLVQGDRRFTPWKGSVLDSVIGVFLTQNVSDHLSSSAFMSLAARYPLKSNGKNKELHDEQTGISKEKQEVHVLEPDDAITWQEKSNHSTCAEGSTTKQYMELNGQNVSNSSEAFQNSLCGIKSTGNSTGQLIDSLTHNLVVNHEQATNGSAVKISQPFTSSVGEQTESDEILSSQNSVDSSVAQTENFESCSLSTFEGETTVETRTKQFSVSTSFIELLHGVCSQGSVNGSFPMYGSSQSECDVCITESTDWSNDAEGLPSNITPCNKSGAQEGGQCSHKELYTTEDSALSAESANQSTLSRTMAIRFEEVPKSTCQTENSTYDHQIQVQLNIVRDSEIHVESQIHPQEGNHKMYQALDSSALLLSTSEVTEKTIITDNPRDNGKKLDQSSQNACYDHIGHTLNPEDPSTSKGKARMSGKQKQKVVDWDFLRKEAQTNGIERERTADTMDSLDWEAIRCTDVKEIADTIKARGMNNMLAERIKDLLNRLMREHGSIDLEWLREVPPDKAKEYLLSFRGLGLKSVECVRLLTLHHLAFPVDTNVGRIAVRLGWVPLQPLPESLQLHLLELYPILESIQKYLWPRLCKLDQRTLYELHYQMITFGKVFCTKSKPNCNACPMRGECRHFASAFASARLALPAPEEKSIVIARENQTADQNSAGGSTSNLCLPPADRQSPGICRSSNDQNSVGCHSSNLCLPPADRQSSVGMCSSSNLCLPQANDQLRAHSETSSSNPIVVVPATPEPTVEEPQTPDPDQTQVSELDIEEFEDPDEIPIIKLNMEEFTQNLQMFVGNSAELQAHEMSKALVALTAEAASIPMPKLKNINRLRTEHHVYELPDSHPLLQGLEQREPDDPCPYLLAIWTPGETANSVQPPERTCDSKESGILCDNETCFSCNSIREANSQTVRGTLLIPCRTAMRGSFPLNGTYFQVNEVFADHASSLNPIDVPRAWIWNLPRRTVYFGTSVPSIFRGLSTEEIQYCFWRGFVCVRGFEQTSRAPRPLMARLHFPASRTRTRGRVDE